jgi:hypothetical protein
MCILEHELLKNRKKRCWYRYYNNSLGDPRYVDQWRENNPSWKGGIKVDDPEAYMEKYNQLPKTKLIKKAYRESPEGKLKNKENAGRPENMAKNRNRMARRRAKNKTETGYTHGYSRAKKKAERQGEGTLEAFLK